MLDTEAGEVVSMTPTHEGNNVREFYSKLPRPVRVGIEATGSMQWFVNLMEELEIECLVDHPAQSFEIARLPGNHYIQWQRFPRESVEFQITVPCTVGDAGGHMASTFARRDFLKSAALTTAALSLHPSFAFGDQLKRR